MFSRFSKIILTLTTVALLLSSVGQAWAQTKSKFIPDCALGDKVEGECADVGIFVTLLINVGKYIFTIVGALALLAFVYGGFTLILSQGNAEKVKKGTGIIVAAITGLIIVFSAYILVQFLGTAVEVKQGLK